MDLSREALRKRLLTALETENGDISQLLTMLSRFAELSAIPPRDRTENDRNAIDFILKLWPEFHTIPSLTQDDKKNLGAEIKAAFPDAKAPQLQQLIETAQKTSTFLESGIIEELCSGKRNIPEKKMALLWLTAGGGKVTNVCDVLKNNDGSLDPLVRTRFLELAKIFLLRKLPGEFTPFLIPNRNLPHEEFMKQLETINLFREQAAEEEGGAATGPACPPVVPIGAHCDDGKLATVVKILSHQRFIARYLTVDNPFKGLFVWHSVGSGKTCSMILAATVSFELDDWAIVWVTRSSLKTDLYKNMFKSVCHFTFREMLNAGVLVMPKDREEQMRLKRKYSKWFLDPVSYAQWGNFITAKWPKELKGYDSSRTLTGLLVQYHRAMGHELPKRPDGSLDLLHKVFVIIDESHRLVARANDPAALDAREMVSDRVLSETNRRLHESYDASGKDSVKLALLSGSPVCRHPTEFFVQMNFLIEKRADFLPTNKAEFDQTWLDPQGNLRGDKAERLRQVCKGLISYVDRSQDVSRFPIVSQVTTVKMEISAAQRKGILKLTEGKTKKMQDKNRQDTILTLDSFSISTWPPNYRMWSKAWKPAALRNALEKTNLSPKFMALMSIIKQIDEQDQAATGKIYKHAIFCSSRGPRGASGPLALACCMAAFGSIWVQDYKLRLLAPKLEEESNNKFCILTKENLPGNPTSYANSGSDKILQAIVGDIKTWCGLAPEEKRNYELRKAPKQGVYNDRLLNLHGEMCRFLLYDRKYTEGVDIFDAKYLHVFTPQLSTCLLSQAIGRVTRYCGLSGLPFVPSARDQAGWKVRVFLYKGYFRHGDAKIQTPFEIAQKYTDKPENVAAINKILNVIAEISVDRAWNAKSNARRLEYGRFSFNEDEMDFSAGGRVSVASGGRVVGHCPPVEEMSKAVLHLLGRVERLAQERNKTCVNMLMSMVSRTSRRYVN